MEIWSEDNFDYCEEEVAEFMFSDLELGIIQDEIEKVESDLKIMSLDRLELILSINDVLNLN